MAGPNKNQSFDAYVITKSDTVANVFDAFMVGATGAVKVTTSTGAVLTLAALPAYTLVPIRIVLMWSAGTDATNLIGLKYGNT